MAEVSDCEMIRIARRKISSFRSMHSVNLLDFSFPIRFVESSRASRIVFDESETCVYMWIKLNSHAAQSTVGCEPHFMLSVGER